NYTGDPAAMRAEVARLAPEDVAGYERFVAQSEQIFDVGFSRLAHMPFGRWRDMARIVPEMLRLESYRTVYGLVSKHVRDDRLRQVLSFHPLLVGGNPFSTTSIYTLILYLERRWGVHFPIGGTGALVRGLVSLLGRMGVPVRLESPVTRLLVEGRRVRGVVLGSGEAKEADLVVCNGDAAWTYKHLVPAEARRIWTDRRIDTRRYSMSLFVWYFGTRATYPDVAHHSILLGPRYRELLRDIFEQHTLAEDFSLYLHRPTATDPSLAPPGCDAFYVLSPVPHLDSGTHWGRVAEGYRDRIAAALEASVLPGLRRNLVTSRVLTPQHFHDELWSYKGAAFGMTPELRQSAYFRPHNQSEDLDNLYFVGAGTHPGAGLPGVLSSARVLDTVVPDAERLHA
ncbi:MAG TPA: phytoene desaturase family protein, partial [Myxococcota bacterium]|nr:phytoene desaturase family protein [Myxococcota bacterium]